MSAMRFNGRPRRWPLVVIALAVVFAIFFTLMSQFFVDLLWYREVGFTSAFWTVIRTKFVLGAIFGLLFFALLLINLLIVRWISPDTRLVTPDQEVVERIRVGVEPFLRWLLPAASAVIALFVGIAVSGRWQTFLLWRHSGGVTFGHPEALFGRDPAFYIFELPWLKFLSGWLFSALVGVTFLSGLAHLVWGGIRPQAPALSDKVTPPVRAHLSVLLGLIMLAKAWGYYLGRFDLLTSKRGVVEGASYTDIHAQLPALSFLAIVAVICAVLFLVNIRVRLWSLPIIAVALLGFVSVALGTAVPAFVQHFSVKPQEQQRETPYIQRNIAGTRAAFGLDKIAATELPADQSASRTDIQNNDATISNIRLWRPEILGQNFQSLQRIRQYYDFNDVDVDRYDIGGQKRVLMVAGREVSQANIPNVTWQSSHLAYTHGFGAVAAQANSASGEGAPVFTLRDIPPNGEPTLQQPRIYYGELNDVPFVITGTKTPEIDYEGAPSPQNYQGSGGIPMGNIFQRALFAWRFRDINLLISGQITSQSRIMIYRDISQRVPRPVPFLSFDHDPYLAITDTGTYWIWDAYTSTDQYPYSQSVDLAAATQNEIAGQVNYMRNSVKVTVDAYTGKMTYYANLSDPIIQVWSDAFPGLFTPIDEAPADLQAHFRYPENLFQVQTTQYGRYHVTDPSVFYNSQDIWQVPDDPTQAQTADQTATGEGTKLLPYYLLMKTPGDTTERFQLVLPFVPQGRQNMVGWMAANSDPGPDYGRIVAFNFPEGRNVLGPAQVFSQINQDPTFSSQRTLLGQGGSSILFGDFLVIPLGNSFLYVEPVYVRSAQSTAVPELKKVLVVNGTTVGLGNNLTDALNATLQGTTTGGGPTGGTGSVDQRVAALLGQALQHFDAANTALTNGNLATYQSELALAQNLVKQANDLAASAVAKGSGSTSGSATPTPTP